MHHISHERTVRRTGALRSIPLVVACLLTASATGAGLSRQDAQAAPLDAERAVPVRDDEGDPAAPSVSDDPDLIGDALVGDVVGSISADIDRGGDPSGSDVGVESDAANLLADAQLFAVRNDGLEADLALVHSGGIRADLEFAASDTETDDGVVTFGEAFTFQPFNSTIFVLPMTGRQIVAALAEQCRPGGSSEPVMNLGVSDGFTYDLAITTQSGVCTSIEVTDVRIDGAELVDDDIYGVVVNNFLANGGDDFDTFAEIDPADRTSGPQDLAALLSYFDAQGVVAPPGTDRVNENFITLPTPSTAVTPSRLLDTRIGPSFLTSDGLFQGRGAVGGGEEIELQVTGRGGVPDGVEAVTLNIGAIRPDSGGFLTVYPCGVDRPTASNLNYRPDATVSNTVTTLVSDAGTVCLYSLVETDLYADVTGYSVAGGSPKGVVAARVLDDRTVDNSGTIDGRFEGRGPQRGGATLELDVGGRNGTGVPADATAAVLNVVAVLPAAGGFVTLYPCGDDLPLASNVNYEAGGDYANSALVGLSDEGTVCIYTSQTANIVVDVSGYVPANGTPDPVTPFRLVETRIGDEYVTVDGQFEGQGRLAKETVLEIDVAGRNDLPDDLVSVNLNVATVNPDSSGYFTVFPCDEVVPQASNVNYEGDDIVANSVTVPLTDEGTVCVFSSQATDFVMDITAALGPIVPARPAVD